MLSGSRLGASFIVLVTGFLYATRHKGRKDARAGLGIGIQAMTMTAIQYIPGMLIAYWLLRAGTLDGVNWHASAELDAVLSRLWGPFVDLAKDNLPGWALFLAGIGTILVSFNLLDRVLPHVDSDCHGVQAQRVAPDARGPCSSSAASSRRSRSRSRLPSPCSCRWP